MGCSDSSLIQQMQNPHSLQEPPNQAQNESHQHQIPNRTPLAPTQPQASTTVHQEPIIRKPINTNQQKPQQILPSPEPQKSMAITPPPSSQLIQVNCSQAARGVIEQQKQQQWKPIPILPIVKKHRGYFKKIMYKHHITEEIIKPMRQYFYSKYDLLAGIKMMRCSGIHLLRNKPFLDLMKLIYEDQFTLNNASNIARAIFQMYKTNHDVFQIMAYLFCQFFWIKKFKENKSTLEIEGMLRAVLKKLCQQFPPTVKGQKSVTEDVPFPSCPEKNINLFGDNDGTFFQSYQSLLFQMKIVNEKAKESLPQFKKLVEYIGQNHQGFNYKSGLKLPTNQYDWFKVLIRVMQKMFPQLKNRKQAIILAAEKQLQKQNKGSMQAVMVSLLDVWINQINQTLKHRGGKAHYFITDLVRGKCMFKNLLAIKKAVNGVITYCADNELEIVELDNRLKKVTQDVVFKILVGEIVCEFQLALEFQYTQFQFGHAFYQIDRSPMGSIFGSYLFIGKGNNIPFIATVRDTLEMFKGERNNPYETESQRESMTVQRDQELIKVLKYIYESFVQSNK